MFHSARIKLTLWYLLIIMIISVSFSGAIYRILHMEIERFTKSQRFRIERQMKEGVIIMPDARMPAGLLPMLTDPELIQDVQNRLLLNLIMVNGGIFIIAGALGYLLAGKTLKPIQNMLDEQNQFISDASHELRTPLTALKSTLEVNLRDKKLTLVQAKKLLSENVSDVNRLQQLSDELLQLAQYQKPNGKQTYTTVSIKSVITQAIHQVAPLAREKRIRIRHTVEQLSMTGNVYELTDLFVILLDNAIKYSKTATTVTLTAKKQHNQLFITIQDQGIGIDTADIPHIFDRFYRVDRARTKQQADGFGLGLSIAKNIVDRYKGTIRVTSEKGKGSIFTILLPIA